MLERRAFHPLFYLLLICSAASTAAEEATARPAAAVADLAWLVGDWSGEKGSGIVEEQWSAEAGGAMMGMFRWLAKDEVRLYEFLLIEPGPRGPVMRIKHFGPGLKGWEEKEESLAFYLESHSAGRAVFAMDPRIEDTRLVYETTGDRALTVSLVKRKEGQESVTRFDYSRR